MVKTVVFDFDGVIADTMPFLVRSANELAEEYGYEELSDLSKIREMNAKQVILGYLEIPIRKIPSFAKKIVAHLKMSVSEVKVFEGIKNVISELSEDYTIGLLTSNNQEYVDTVFENNEVEGFDFFYTDASLLSKKKALKKMLKSQGLKKEEVIYVGDEMRDISSCKAVGIKVIAVSWGYNSLKALKKKEPDFIAKKPKDLLKIIKGL